MASPQLENGYTKIANEILEALAKVSFRGSTRNVLDCVLRKTYGFSKKEDKISISQFCQMIGVSKRTVIYSIQELEEKNIIFVKKNVNEGEKDTNTYEFNKNYETWVVQNSARQVKRNRELANLSSAKLRSLKGGSAKLGKEVVQNSVKNVKSFAHTKETIQKKDTKETSDVPSQDIVDVIDSFKVVNPSYQKWFANTTQREAIMRMLKIHGKERLLKVIGFLPRSNLIPYIPKITSPLQLEDKWASLEAGLRTKKIEVEINKPKIAFQ